MIPSRLKSLFPIFRTLENYSFKLLQSDVLAGMTTAVVLIPQSMAYALLAGLPAYVGLYAAAVPLLAYALLGTSPALAVGPVATDSLLTATAVGALAQVDSADYLLLAALLAMLAGLVQVGFGVLRLGFVVNALSQPVITGFTAGIALIIGFNQLKLITGIPLTRTSAIGDILTEAMARWRDLHPATFALGLGSILTLVVLKRFKPAFPRALLVLILGSLAVLALNLGNQGVAILGAIPHGFPTPRVPELQLAQVYQLLPSALTIAIVAFVEAMSVAKSLQKPEHPELEANRELVALGTSNLVAGIFGAYSVTGGFSRSAVNASAGAKSQVAAIVTAAMVAITLIFFSPFLAYVPNAALGAIILTATFSLIDRSRLGHYWRVRRSDFWLYCLTFAATLLFGIQMGIFAGVVMSLLWFIAATSKPHIAVLGRLPDTKIYRNINRFPEAIQTPGQLIVRFDAPLFFANTTFLKNQLNALTRGKKPPITTIILDASGIGRIDATGTDMLMAFTKELEDRGIALHLACLRGPVRDVLTQAGLFDILPKDRLVMELQCLPVEREDC